MSLSVSGSCLKIFLKSSLRCLYVGLSTCSDTQSQKRHAAHCALLKLTTLSMLSDARTQESPQPRPPPRVHCFRERVRQPRKSSHRSDRGVGFALLIPWIFTLWVVFDRLWKWMCREWQAEVCGLNGRLADTQEQKCNPTPSARCRSFDTHAATTVSICNTSPIRQICILVSDNEALVD